MPPRVAPFAELRDLAMDAEVTVAAAWDGEPNGLAVAPDGQIAIADYKQVGAPLSLCDLF